ncbi:MAG TPA: hypothetical protein VLF20_02510 [Patescibacteria group bacterium]|nr:hypothetical protein [Patescibacteria group bacterium]
MFVKRRLSQVIDSLLTPLILIPKKIEKLRPHFDLQPHEQTIEPSPSTSREKGHEEYLKNRMRKKEETKELVNQLVKKSNRRILSISSFSLFPNLFKNTIEIEESRIIFIFQQPFTFQSHSIDIADISNVFIDSALFFASMQVVSRTFTENTISIGYLNKHEANQARMIIEGLRTFARAKIDTSVYEKEELIKKLEELHQTR